MYLKLFGLSEKPFHITPNPRFIFLSKIHKEAFAHLLYGIQQRVGFLSLTGEVGTGKTTVLRTLLQQLAESEYKVALVFNPCLTDIELLQSIHREFGIEYDADRSNLVSLHDSLNRFLLGQREAGKTVVLVVDEAQNLDPAVLEQLRLLSNLETETEKLIQMVLVGQPELDELFARKDLRQLRQRLTVRYQLTSMDTEDTSKYIQHRVRIAGWQNGPLFSEKALQRVYWATGGTPRLINILCDRAMLVAYSRDSRQVTQHDVAAARKELGISDQAKRSSFLPIAAFVFCAFLIGFAGSQYLNSLHKPEARTSIVQPQPLVKPESSVAANVPVVQPSRPAPVAAEKIQQLQQAIADLSIDNSVASACRVTAKLWKRELSKLPVIENRFALKSALQQNGFNTVDFKGDLDELTQMNTPSVLEIILPNVNGKRYLALVEATDDQVRTVPSITASGWLSKQELQHVWFGRAILPYVNFEQIRLVDSPEQTGTDIDKLQSMLRQLYGEEGLNTGRYDRKTIEAVIRFQLEHQLAPDGRVGSQTLFWLYRVTGREMPLLTSGGAS
ncbi:MAG TPA: AAA family ATPase [Malonomonas sp.]